MIDAYHRGATLLEAASTVGLSRGAAKLALLRYGDEPRSASVAQRRYLINERYFEHVDTEEKAYWLGFISADGCVYNKRLTITLADSDHGHLEKFAAAIGPTLPIRRFVANGHPAASISTRSELLADDLERLGVRPAKSFTIEPWSDCTGLLGRHYWRGFVDGNGGVADRPRRVYLCSTEAVVINFLRFANSVCGTRTVPHKASATPSLRVCEIGGRYIAPPLIAALYGDVAIALDRKMEIATRILTDAAQEPRK